MVARIRLIGTYVVTSGVGVYGGDIICAHLLAPFVGGGPAFCHRV